MTALRDRPLPNTSTYLVTYDQDALARLKTVFSESAVAGSSQIRHAHFCEEGVRLSRFSCTPPELMFLIPREHMDAVVSSLPAAAPETMITGVKWEGDATPAVMRSTVDWAAHHGHDKTPVDATPPPGMLSHQLGRRAPLTRLVDSHLPTAAPPAPAGSLLCLGYLPHWNRSLDKCLYHCRGCWKQFVFVSAVEAHLQRGGCPGPSSNRPKQVVAVASAMAVGAAPIQVGSASSVRVTPSSVQAPGSSAMFPAGWAATRERRSEELDPDARSLLDKWFDGGAAGLHARMTAAVAVKRLSEMRDGEGDLLFEAGTTLPTEAKVKAYFSTRSNQQKKAASAAMLASQCNAPPPAPAAPSRLPAPDGSALAAAIPSVKHKRGRQARSAVEAAEAPPEPQAAVEPALLFAEDTEPTLRKKRRP